MMGNRALVATDEGVVWRDWPMPVPGAGQLRLRVECGGVCRTDVAVARSRVPGPRPLVLGHEFTGEVEAAGPGLEAWEGRTVVVMPVGQDGACYGVDEDGGFARYAVVGVDRVRAVSTGLPATVRAFAEPVAACLAPVNHLSPTMKVGVVGDGRIAALTVMCLRAAGMQAAPWRLDTDASPVDALVETSGRLTDLDPLLGALEPGGVLVLKSRRMGRVTFDVASALRREVSVAMALYADFDRAVDLLGVLPLGDLVGPVLPITQWRAAFDASESRKVFLDPWREG